MFQTDLKGGRGEGDEGPIFQENVALYNKTVRGGAHGRRRRGRGPPRALSVRWPQSQGRRRILSVRMLSRGEAVIVPSRSSSLRRISDVNVQ